MLAAIIDRLDMHGICTGYMENTQKSSETGCVGHMFFAILCDLRFRLLT